MTALSSAQVWFRTGDTALGCEQMAKSTSNPVQERQVTVTAIWGWVLLIYYVCYETQKYLLCI